jgi:deoxyribose-phosphate aldolase
MIDYAKYIDHTLLKPNITHKELEQHVAEAIKYGFQTVCVNPSQVQKCSVLVAGSGIKITSVVGFPLGANTVPVKQLEAEKAVSSGASELDYVINLSWAANCEWNKIEAEASHIVNSVPSHVIVKAIIETGLHSDSQIINLTEAVTNGGVDFVKTCSGFNGGEATLHAVELIRKAGARNVKASGGIKTAPAMSDFISMGVKRIGTSNSVRIMEQYLNKTTDIKETDY